MNKEQKALFKRNKGIDASLWKNTKSVFFMILKTPFASWMQNILLMRCCAGSWVVPKI